MLQNLISIYELRIKNLERLVRIEKEVWRIISLNAEIRTLKSVVKDLQAS